MLSANQHACTTRGTKPPVAFKRIKMPSISHIIATELHAKPEQVESAIRLLDEGSTVPFIARYRKEVTGGLDDTQLRNLEQRLGYLRELEERRAVILNSIEEQGNLTPALRAELLAAAPTERTRLIRERAASVGLRVP